MVEVVGMRRWSVVVRAGGFRVSVRVPGASPQEARRRGLLKAVERHVPSDRLEGPVEVVSVVEEVS
jgi:hypothetical protein